MQRFLALEKVTRRAPLGLRFLDLTRGVPVTDGLVVTAWPKGTNGPKQMAMRSPLSGVYGFRSLPGFGRFERAERPASDWCGPPETSPPELTAEDLTNLNTLHGLLSTDENAPRANYIVYVVDQMERFLPQVLLMCLPKEQLIEVPLFSSPARSAPVGSGIVRGELLDQSANPKKPASWALVTASPDDNVTTYVSIADARGMFTLFIPYASALPPLEGSPPRSSGTIDQLTWRLTIQVFYQPSRQTIVTGLKPPDILSSLDQERTNVYDEGNVAGPSLFRPISFGGDLVVKTPGQSQLLVDAVPPSSPP